LKALQNSSQQEFSSFKLLEIHFYPGSPGRASEIVCSICVSLMENLGGDIAERHTLEEVFKSQPLKHNGERALTPAAHCQIRLAGTVLRLPQGSSILRIDFPFCRWCMHLVAFFVRLQLSYICNPFYRIFHPVKQDRINFSSLFKTSLKPPLHKMSRINSALLDLVSRLRISTFHQPFWAAMQPSINLSSS
jgi:hypothetical protein